MCEKYSFIIVDNDQTLRGLSKLQSANLIAKRLRGHENFGKVTSGVPREPRSLRISPKALFFIIAYKQIDNILVASTTALTS